jgi:hypothetical protein
VVSRPARGERGRAHGRLARSVAGAGRTNRRAFLAALAGVLGGACARPPAAPTPAPPAALPNQADVARQARAIVAAAFASLNALDTFAAWRVSRAGSGLRSPSELEWDPPSSSAWRTVDDLSSLRRQAQDVFQSVARTTVDVQLWREQRDLAQRLHELVEAVDAQAAYRAALDHLDGPDGEASAVLGLLDRARELWQRSATTWGVERTEPIACGS